MNAYVCKFAGPLTGAIVGGAATLPLPLRLFSCVWRPDLQFVAVIIACYWWPPDNGQTLRGIS